MTWTEEECNKQIDSFNQRIVALEDAKGRIDDMIKEYESIQQSWESRKP